MIRKPKRRAVQIYLTPNQRERAFLAMQAAGYATMSAYARSLILGETMGYQKMISEIHKKIVLEDSKDGSIDGKKDKALL